MQITYMSVKSESNQILTFKRNAKMLRLKKRYITYDNKEYNKKLSSPEIKIIIFWNG